MSLLTQRREEAGLSITACAQRAGIPISKLSRLEHGKLKLKVDDLLRLARTVGCQPSALVPELGEDSPIQEEARTDV